MHSKNDVLELDVQMDTVQLPTSHSQRLKSGKSPGTGRCGQLHRVQMNRSPKLVQYALR